MSELLSEPLLDVADVARLFKVRRAWVYAAVEAPDGTIPHIRLGRYIRFKRHAITAWMDRREKGESGCAPGD